MTMTRPSRYGRMRTPGLVLLLLAGVATLTIIGCAPRAGAAAPGESARSGAVAASEASGAPDEPAGLTPAQRDLHIQSFDHVWMTVATKHFDPTLGGLDWGAVRAELRPRVVNARTAGEARAATGEMLRRLGQSHFAIIPVEAYEGLDARRPRGSAGQSDEPGEAGLTIRMIGGRAVVAGVRPEGPAARAGVKTGFIVDAVAGEAIGPVVERLRGALASQGEGLLNARLTLSIEARFDGFNGESVEAVFLDGADHRVKRTIVLGPPVGLKAKLGNLPEMRVECEYQTLGGGASGGGGGTACVGYVRLSTFLEPGVVMPKMMQAVEACRACDGLVIDLRGNLGGLGGMAMGVGGLLVSEPDQRLGTMTTRGATLNFVLNPRLNPYTGPVAILVDGLSLSTSEILAGGLQDLRRARVLGERTGGAALPSVIERLPSGDGFQYAFANYTSAGGRVLEGTGVMPDEPVPLTREALLAGRDAALDAAVKWIHAAATSETGRGR